MRTGPPALKPNLPEPDDGFSAAWPFSEYGAALSAELVMSRNTEPVYAGCVRRRLPKAANCPLNGARRCALAPPLPPRPPPNPPPPPRPPPPPPPGPPATTTEASSTTSTTTSTAETAVGFGTGFVH